MSGTFEYTLEPEDNGTKVVFTCEVRPHGFMWVFTPLLLRGTRLRYEQQLPNLKKEVEKA